MGFRLSKKARLDKENSLKNIFKNLCVCVCLHKFMCTKLMQCP